jgi:hypothetical protein
MKIDRAGHRAELLKRLRRYPVVGLLGARRVGKTTLAADVARAWKGPVTAFDLEDPAHLARLADPALALTPLKGLVVLDEIQHLPDVFPLLRVLADRRPLRTRSLVLGSASPTLLRQSSESLAGRISYHELPGFSLAEVGRVRAGRLWRRGGFPRSFLARSDEASAEWRRDFLRTFLERDLPQLGVTVPAATLRRFWGMLAHYHAQVWNSSEFARSFAVADTTVRRYLDTLTAALVVRQLPPWSENVGKRQVKSPKVYLADSGLLHTLLGLDTQDALESHPKLGASWEGFGIQAVVDRLGARSDECFFWGTYAGAELDLLVVRGKTRLGFEFKRTAAPQVTPSMRVATADLKLARLDVVHAGAATFPLAPRIRALALERLLDDLTPF